MRIKLKSIEVEKGKIIFKIEFDESIKYFTKDEDLFYAYDTNVENVPLSLLCIPFIADMLPFVYALNAELILDEIDSQLLSSIDELRQGYQKMIPTWKMEGKVSYNKIVKNEYTQATNALLFSGGIDAMNSLIMNNNIVTDLISIWGSDIKYENEDGWAKTFASIQDIASKFNKKIHVIRSNFRSFINEKKLDEVVKTVGDSRWHGFQHGVALIGQVAPLSYIYGYKAVFIASSFTREFNPICASNPLTDNAFFYGSTKTIHDGFEFDRSDKVFNICDFLEKYNERVKLHVCWESQSGQNCGCCEKCIRSYLNCLSVNKDPHILGLDIKLNMNDIKNRYLKRTFYDEHELDRFRVLKKHILKTYDIVPADLNRIVETDFKKLNNRFYLKARRFAGKIKRKLISLVEQ